MEIRLSKKLGMEQLLLGKRDLPLAVRCVKVQQPVPGHREGMCNIRHDDMVTQSFLEQRKIGAKNA